MLCQSFRVFVDEKASSTNEHAVRQYVEDQCLDARVAITCICKMWSNRV
jgi:hypothetical protein